MRVCILGFGSTWRRRSRESSDDPTRFAHAAYFNTTGVMAEGRLRTRPRILGHVRFNGVGGFNPNEPARMIGRTFDCAEPCVWRGQNKILVKTLLPAKVEPERYLVVAKAADAGLLRVGDPRWCSEDVWVIALSNWREEQEAMLLMVPHSWVTTTVGVHRLVPLAGRSRRARLELTVDREA